MLINRKFLQALTTPLIASAANGHSDVVGLLCERGAEIEGTDQVLVSSVI